MSEKAPNIEPLYDNVVLQADEGEEVTESGIFIPDTAKQEKKQIGKVIAVGPGKFNNEGNRMPMHVKVGDKVIYPQYAGDEVKIDEIEYKVVSEDRILGIIK